MNAFVFPVLTDQTWGVLSLLLAGVISLWLLFQLRSRGHTVVETPVVDPPASAPEEMVSFATVIAAYESRRRSCEANRARIEGRLLELSEMRLESWEVCELRAFVSPTEVANLAATVGMPAESSWDAIVDAIRKAGSHSAAEFVRRRKGAEPFVPYREVLRDVAKKVGAKFAPKDLDATVEKAIITSSLEQALSRATPDQHAALIQQIDADTRKMGGLVAGAAGTVAVANLSGFGLYVAASSVVGAVTSAVGVTLPFAVYTGMSTTIATLIGPVGWLAIIIAAVTVAGSINYKKTIPAVMAIAQSRLRLIAERDQATWALIAEKDKLADAEANVAELAALVERMRAQGLNFVPRSSVPL